MKSTKEIRQILHCTVQNYNFSPRGGIEGLIVEVDGETAQVTFEEDQDAAFAKKVKIGKKVHFVVEPDFPGPKSEHAEHPVYIFHSIATSDDKEKLVRTKAVDKDLFTGLVVRLNYARHGEPNGAILDNGDFIHLKPDGMTLTGLNVGDSVEAEGEVQETVLGSRVIEATRVNGIRLKKPKHK